MESSIFWSFEFSSILFSLGFSWVGFSLVDSSFSFSVSSVTFWFAFSRDSFSIFFFYSYSLIYKIANSSFNLKYSELDSSPSNLISSSTYSILDWIFSNELYSSNLSINSSFLVSNFSAYSFNSSTLYSSPALSASLISSWIYLSCSVKSSSTIFNLFSSCRVVSLFLSDSISYLSSTWPLY